MTEQKPREKSQATLSNFFSKKPKDSMGNSSVSATKRKSESIDPAAFFASKKGSTAKKSSEFRSPVESKVEVLPTKPLSKSRDLPFAESAPTTKKKKRVINDDDSDEEFVQINEKVEIDERFIMKEETVLAPILETKKEPTPVKTKGAAYAQFLAKKAKISTGPREPSNKVIPEGAENCLQGLTFVFTGEMESLSREEAQDLVRRLAGRVTTACSSKTSYLVVGEDAGASKIEKAKKLGLKTLSEDQLFELINSSPPKGDTPAMKAKPKSSKSSKTISPESKVAEETTKIVSYSSVKSSVVEHPKSEVVEANSNLQQTSNPAEYRNKTLELSKNESLHSLAKISSPIDANIQSLWTVKYKPTAYNEIIGNKASVERLASWLRKWDQYLSNGFKKTGSDDFSDKRAVLISGPPGIGKTTTAHLVAELEGLDAVEFNASDVRSKKSIDTLVKELTGSYTIGHYFLKGAQKDKSKKQLIIMDECDGMSSGDRGGNLALIQLIKITKVPIICICNDRQSPKIRTLANYCFDMRFRRATSDQVESRLRSIALKEGLDLKANVIQNLVASTQGDIRQIINILSTYRLSNSVLTFDGSKDLIKISEKDVSLGPWDIIKDLFGNSRTMSLSTKIEMYFQDYQLIPLMIQENYIGVTPSIRGQAKLSDHEILTQLSKAADSISLADNVEETLRRTNNWTLLPIHAVLSTITPAFHMGGMSQRIDFPGWLGQFSKQNKYQRIMKEIQIRMRLSISGDKTEVRQTYISALAKSLVQPLISEGKAGVSKVIELMDDYYLTKEDFDSILEIGIGINDQKVLMKDIAATVKSELTRTYNKGTHPIPFSASALQGQSFKATASALAKPDFQEVISDEEIGVDEEEEPKDEDALGTDKLIKKKIAKEAKAKPIKKVMKK